MVSPLQLVEVIPLKYGLTDVFLLEPVLEKIAQLRVLLLKESIKMSLHEKFTLLELAMVD